MKTGSVWGMGGIRTRLEKIANTGQPPENQTVIRPKELLDPLRIRDQIRSIDNRLVEADIGEDKLKTKCDRIEKLIEARSRHLAETRMRLQAEKRALQEKLLPLCHECGLKASLPDVKAEIVG